MKLYKPKLVILSLLYVYLLPNYFIYAQEKRPEVYATYGLIPGLGQFLLGDYATGAMQLGLFIGFLGSSISLQNRSDFIPYGEEIVSFQLEDVILADFLENNGFLYQDVPFISESTFDRLQRMIQYKKIIEINPFIEYGSYKRMTYSSTANILLSQSAQHVVFYSVYSSYRDAGGIYPATLIKEDFFDLAIAPFQMKYILNPYFLVPIGLLSIVVAYETSHPPKNPQWTLLYPGMKQSGYMNFYNITLSFNAGVGEEAFFRGFLNHFLIKEMGLVYGLLSSSVIFGIAHLGNGVGNVISATLGGLYFGFLHYKENWDFRQAIAVHFWWDVILLTMQVRYMKEDKNVLKSRREIYFMPIIYEFKF